MAQLSKILARAARAAFRASGDLSATITWRQLKPGAYDVTTGTVQLPQVDVHPRAIIEALSAAQAQSAGVSDKGLRVIILGEDLAGVEPKDGDQVIIGQRTYTVKRVVWNGYPAILEALVDL